MMDVQVKLHINVKPVLANSSACSVHRKKKFEVELQNLEVAGIIEKVDGPTGWVSPIVPEKDADIRFCIDTVQPNQIIKITRNSSPTRRFVVC